MGGSKKQTVGYRYLLGVHMALCHGPVDAIREIRVDDRVAWSVTTGGASGGGGAAVEPLLGVVSGMFATPGASEATISLTGILIGARIGQSYRLVLGGGGGSPVVTLRGVLYDKDSGVTTWSVLPESLSFAAQSAQVFEVQAGVSNAGAGGGRIRIDVPELFGGESREGGIVGDIDVLMGDPGQGQNDYLAAQMGGAVPGYRGVLSLVLRQVYLGNNPYLKPWAVRLTRVLMAESGTAQWYPQTAKIVPEAAISDAAIYIALDASGSMQGARTVAAKAAIAALIVELAANDDPDAPNDIQILTWSDVVANSILQRNATAADYDALGTWINALPDYPNGGTNFGMAFAEAAAFFAGSAAKRRIIIFVTDGEPYPPTSVDVAEQIIATLPQSDIFGFNIALADTSFTARIDNTPVDGVPVIPAGDSTALVASLRGAFGIGPDMNPAHIIRECLSNRDWGLGYNDVDIGASFTGAADTLFAEGFGLSFLWQRDGSIEDFIAGVLDHIDAILYIDRKTGLWEIRLIRDDYVPASLPVFDESNVVDWGRLSRRAQGDLVNSVTVKFTNSASNDTGAVSVTDTARAQLMGEVLAATLDYPGIGVESLAVRVAGRDLRALSSPLMTGEIVVNRQGANLGPGDLIRISSPRQGLDDVVMRITEISLGDGSANGVRLKLAEDVFALGAMALAGGKPPRVVAITSTPQPLNRRMVAEAPYWLVVREVGHAAADTSLTDDPDGGVLVAVGGRPSQDALAAELWIDPGTGYVSDGTVAFVPSAELAVDVPDDPDTQLLAVTGWQGIGDIGIGTLAMMGGELIRIDGITATTIQAGRGCLDTVPRAHPAGTPILFFDALANLSQATFAAGETVLARLLPQTAQGTLALALAAGDTVVMDRRAIRPLPAGRMQGNASYAPAADALIVGDLVLSWAHRDRLAQTSVVIDDYTAGNIGPEPGVGYIIEIRWIDPDTGLAVLPAAAQIDVGTVIAATLTAAEVPEVGSPGRTFEIDVLVRARRLQDGVWVYAREDRAFRLIAPFAAGWGKGWGALWGKN